MGMEIALIPAAMFIVGIGMMIYMFITSALAG